MADNKTIFNPGKDDNGDGAAPHIKQRGQDGTGKDMIPVLPVQKNDDTLAQMLTRPEGDPAADEGFPVFSFKTESGDYIYPTTDNAGAINVNIGGGGSRISNYATVTATKGSDIDVALIDQTQISATDNISEIEIVASSSKPVLWKLVSIDDANGTPAETERLSFLSDSGEVTVIMKLNHLDYTAGATGDQNLVLRGNQLTGSGSDSDLHGYVGAKAS
jgi:hypothetical protein